MSTTFFFSFFPDIVTPSSAVVLALSKSSIATAPSLAGDCALFITAVFRATDNGRREVRGEQMPMGSCSCCFCTFDCLF